MPSNPTPASGEREVCERCGLPKATSLQDYLDRGFYLENGAPANSLCGDHLSGSPYAHVYCRDATIARLRSQLEQRDGRNAGTPDDLRTLGWSVAVHNDYRLGGERWTFWLLTKGDRCVKGEGRTDADALSEIRKALDASAALASAEHGREDGGKT